MLLIRRVFREVTLRRMLSSTVSPTELRVPVPHGHIAAKVWGSPDAVAKAEPSCRVLGVHGWQDNANTFDPIMNSSEEGLQKKLAECGNSKGLCVVSMDFSGHGLSSHLPPGSPYSHHRYLLDMAAVANHLNWETFSVMGHSMGAGIGFYFALMFPHRIAKLASFDGTFPYWHPSRLFEMLNENAYSWYQTFNKNFVENKIRPLREWTLQEYLDALAAYNRIFYPESPEGSLNYESSLILLKRGSTPTADGTKFTLNRDPNVRQFFTEMSGSTLLASFLHRFKGSDFAMLSFRPERGTPVFLDTWEILDREAGQHMKFYESFSVPGGTHHVHMNEPAKVLPKLSEFLLKS